VWSAIGTATSRRRGRREVEPQQARALYYLAWENYNVGAGRRKRIPGKMKAYQKALEAFRAYGRLLDPPLETVRIPFEAGDRGLPAPAANVRPAPIVFASTVSIRARRT